MKDIDTLLVLMFVGLATASMAQNPNAIPTSQSYKTSHKGYECYAVTDRKDCEKCEAKGEYGQVSTPTIPCFKCKGVSKATLAKFPCSSCSNTRKVKDPNYVPPRKCEVCNGRGMVLTLGHKFQVADANVTELLSWNDAMFVCSSIGDGWRLPTKEELTGMYEFLYRKGKGNFKTDHFCWTSSENNTNTAWGFRFESEQANYNIFSKGYPMYARAVRHLKAPHQGANSSNQGKQSVPFVSAKPTQDLNPSNQTKQSLPSAYAKIIQETVEINQETRIEVTVVEMEEEVAAANPEIFTDVEEMPSFPGGDQELLRFIAENTKYPPLARENGVQGIVVVTCVVDERGRIDKVQLLRGIGGGCDEEAIRVLKAMPLWSPGKQRGMPVRVQYNFPFRFTLR